VNRLHDSLSNSEVVDFEMGSRGDDIDYKIIQGGYFGMIAMSVGVCRREAGRCEK
jgi:hypothetical protein